MIFTFDSNFWYELISFWGVKGSQLETTHDVPLVLELKFCLKSNFCFYLQMQEAAQAMEQDRKDMEQRVHDLQIQLDEAEQNALKWGRKMIGKLENRIKELEGEMDSEQRRLGDAMKNYRKTERGIKEYQFRQDEDRKNAERMQDLVDKLQQQVRIITLSCHYWLLKIIETAWKLKVR